MSAEITLGGYTLAELKAMKTAVAKDAQAFIATELENGKAIFEELKALLEDFEYDDIPTDEMQTLAQKANDSFSIVDLVAAISGVSFWIEYYEEYGHEGDPMSRVLDDLGFYYNKGNLSALYQTLSGMEEKVCNWHSSKC